MLETFQSDFKDYISNNFKHHKFQECLKTDLALHI